MPVPLTMRSMSPKFFPQSQCFCIKSFFQNPPNKHLFSMRSMSLNSSHFFPQSQCFCIKRFFHNPANKHLFSMRSMSPKSSHFFPQSQCCCIKSVFHNPTNKRLLQKKYCPNSVVTLKIGSRSPKYTYFLTIPMIQHIKLSLKPS